MGSDFTNKPKLINNYETLSALDQLFDACVKQLGENVENYGISVIKDGPTIESIRTYAIINGERQDWNMDENVEEKLFYLKIALEGKYEGFYFIADPKNYLSTIIFLKPSLVKSWINKGLLYKNVDWNYYEKYAKRLK